jgi:DNA modification methylase
MNTFCANRDELLASHPTVKNTQMIADAILDVTKRKDIVLDAFLGSGTTIVAAESTGRICYGIEIEPRYVEVCIERFRSVSSEPVIHIESGQTFDELKKSRQGQSKLEVVSHGQ